MSLVNLREKGLELEDGLYSLLSEREKEKEDFETVKSKDFRQLAAALVKSDSDESVKKQIESLKKSIVEEDTNMNDLFLKKFKQLEDELKSKLKEIEKVEDELVSEPKTDLTKKHENLQNQIRFLRDRELYLLEQLNITRSKHWIVNRDNLVDHYERFVKIQRGLTKAKLSDEMVNKKSEEFCATLKKEKEGVYSSQRDGIAAIQAEFVKIMESLMEVEDKIRAVGGGPLADYPYRRIPGKIEIAPASLLEFELYSSQ